MMSGKQEITGLDPATDESKLLPAQMARRASLIAGIALGLLGGIGLFTFHYAQGLSYMSNDPAVCANCHVMKEQLDSWTKSGHHAAAVCNDCHTPGNLPGKLMTKALNGYHHSKAFTLGNFHEPIMIKEYNRRITESSCRKCHADIVHQMDAMNTGCAEQLSCIRCHSGTGHM